MNANRRNTSRRPVKWQQRLRHLWWRWRLRVGGDRHRLLQLNRLAVVALGHLQINANARLLATNDVDGRTGFALHVDWQFPLPPTEQLALQAYVKRKIQEISGLDLKASSFEVFVRDFGTPVPMAEADISSHWLRERIAQIAIQTYGIYRAPPNMPSGGSDRWPGVRKPRNDMPTQRTRVELEARRKEHAQGWDPTAQDSRHAQSDAWEATAQDSRSQVSPEPYEVPVLLDRIDVGVYMTEYGALRETPFVSTRVRDAQPTQPMVFDDEVPSSHQTSGGPRPARFA